MLPFGHYQTVSISLRAALQPRAETFPFPPFAGTGRSETIRRPVFFVAPQPIDKSGSGRRCHQHQSEDGTQTPAGSATPRIAIANACAHKAY